MECLDTLSICVGSLVAALGSLVAAFIAYFKAHSVQKEYRTKKEEKPLN